ADLLRLDPGALQRAPHGAGGAEPLGVGGDVVVHVGARAVADDLGLDPGAALARVLIVLQDHHHGALAHHETVTADVEWAAGSLGLIVPLADRLDLAERSQRQGGDRGLGATRDHGDRVAPLDDLGRLADAVGAGRAGADHGVVGTAGAQVHGDQAGAHVRDHHRDGEGADAAHAALQQHGLVLLDLLHSADGGGDDDADIVGVHLVRTQARLLDRHLRRGQRELAEAPDVPRGLAVHVVGSLEVADLAGDLAAVLRGVETGDRADAGDALDQV